ncbi:MAG: thioredoxin family protein [Candidatus Fermentibacteraceae bacterium]
MKNTAILLCVTAFFVACGQQAEPIAQSGAETVEAGTETEIQEILWIHDDFDAAAVLAVEEGKLIFIDFYADWCPPCQTLADEYFPRPDYQQFLSGVVTLKVNVDNEPDIAQRYSVSSIPTLVLTDAQGNELDRVVGITGSPEEFLEVLEGLGAN